MNRDIKQEILQKLSLNKALSYSEARPDDVANDLYNYHLQHLVSKGLVLKKNKKYQLTEEGIKYIHFEQPVSLQVEVPEMFKLGVLLILYNSETNTVLAQKRKRRPHYDSWGIIGGVVKHGEHITKAASRVFKEETGLDVDFKKVGVLRNIKHHDDELFCDSIFYVCVADEYDGVLKKETEHGFHKWIDLDQAIHNEDTSPQRTQGLLNVFSKIKNCNSIDIPFVHHEEDSHLKSVK